MSTNTKMAEALQDGLSVCNSVSMAAGRRVVIDGCVLYAQTEEWCQWAKKEVRPRLQTALNAHDAEQSAKAVPAAWKPAPVYRGYALLGTGRYLLDSTDAPADPELGAELIISIASEKDREGREIGERRDMPARTIQPDDMAVRIGFANERGLFALEDQLWMLRQEHWPGTKSAAMLAAAPTPPAPEAKSCHITGTCKHGSWCSEVYCQEHCQFVEAQAAPEAQQPAGRASVDDWERELSAAMPADFKDWWQNSPIEWPAVAAAVIKSLRLDRDAGWEVAARAQRRERLTDGQLSALLKEARKIIRASSSRSLAKDWDRRATQALAGATTGEQHG